MSVVRKPVVVGTAGLALAIAAYVVQAPGRSDGDQGSAYTTGAVAAEHPGPTPATSPEASWDDGDWRLFHERVQWALDRHLDAVPIGEAMAALGRTFVGTAYVPQTLEVPGPERVVVNFHGLDCVTFVETAFSLARFVRLQDARTLLEDRPTAERRYEALVAEIRYRDGMVDGYASRLHYFSEWIADNQRRGYVRDVTDELGGVRDEEPVTFMSTHAEAYPGLSGNSSALDAIRATEARLSEAGRWTIRQDRVEVVAEDIQDGDIIAATSTVEGLDVAHTGLALWVDGALRLMHAPLVGDSVQISSQPLARRLLRIASQDGIMVARPCEEGGC